MACIGLINGYRRCATAPKYAPKTVKKRHEITSYTARYGENHFYDARYILFFETLLEKHMGDKKIRKNIILYIVVLTLNMPLTCIGKAPIIESTESF